MDKEFQMKGNVAAQFTYPVVLTFFFLGSAILYNPFNIEAYFTFGSFSSSFHLVMISSIILLCSIASRTILFFFLKKHDLKWWQYYCWCGVEMFIMSAFAALYTQLFKGGEEIYFNILKDCIKFIFLTLCYPYIFLILYGKLGMRNEEIEKLKQPYDNSLIRFYDEHKRLKLSLAPSSILFVSSEFNYLRIHYLDAGKVSEFKLRASLKSLEGLNSKCLVRCHRSYFVNPEHITILRKDPEGFIFAKLNVPDVPAVPVSKQYYNSLSALL